MRSDEAESLQAHARALEAENARFRARLAAFEGAPSRLGAWAARSTPADRDVLFSAIEKTRMPMILTDPHQPDDPIIFVNRAFQELSGYSSDELVGRNCRFLQGPGTDPAQVREIREAIAANRDVAVEIVNYRRDGTSFVNELYISPVFGADGDLLYRFGSQLDVTSHANLRRSLQTSEARQRAIFDSAVDFAIVATDRDGRITDWNAGAEKIFGATADRMRGEPIASIFTPEDIAAGRPAAEMRTALGSGRASDENWLRRIDGSRFWASGETTPLRGPEGGHEGFVKILRDVGEARDVAERLRGNEAFTSRVLASSDDCIKVLDLDGKVTFMSEGGMRVMEVDDFGRIEGCPWPDFWEGESRAEAEAAIAAAKAGGAGHFQAFCRTLAGTPKWWDVRVTPILGADGRPERLLSVSRDVSEQLAIRNALEAERVLLSQMFEQAPTFMALLSGPQHRIERANPGYIRLTGGRSVIGRTVAEALPDAVAQGFVDILDRVYRTGEPFSATGHRYAVQAVPGGPVDERYVDFVYQPVRDASGTVTGIFIEGADVTDRQRTQSELDDSRERYRTLFDSIDEGFCIIEFLDGPHGPLSDYVHVEANPAYTHHAGIPDVVGQKVREMVPDEADGWVALYGGVLRTGEPIRFQRELVATGRYLELAAFRIEPPSRKQVAVLFQDITARKRAETVLRETNEALEARVDEALAERKILADIVEGTNAFVQVADAEFRWLAINGAASREFERIFGVRPKVGDSMLGALADMPEHQAAVRAVWSRALGGEEFVQVEAFGDTARDRRHYEMRFGVLRDGDGRQIGAFQFVYDVSERLEEQERLRDAEDALRQSQKMEAVGQLTGGIAHDFNNLLTGISGSLELMQTRVSQGRVSEIDRYVSAAQVAARRAASLTHRLLAFSRRQTLDPKATDVNRLVIGMEELVRRSAGPQITLEVVTAAGLWPALVDPPQLENALLNLCINARDAMPDGGRITIETANKWLDERAARQRDLKPGQYLSLCVTDTGTGMMPGVIEKAFDPFFTTKPIGQGTGLGLSMIYGFARQSGGQVRIYSEVGEGTTVCIYLPRHYGGMEDEEIAAPDAFSPLPAAAGETVLVVDDEPTVRMLVTEVLDDLGYTAIEAPDGASGLRLLQSDARVDLVVTDVGLPGGMNGRQMIDAARVARPDLKVLFITGYAENAIIGNGHLEPGMQVMTKPFVMEALAVRIREMIEER